MSDSEEGAFVVRDKRGRSDEKDFITSPPQAEQPDHSAHQAHESHPPVTFSSFIYSLGTSALILMGESLDPKAPTPPMNLPQAKEIIDILSVLEAKTQGNLTSEEQSVMTDMLYALRMKYVDLASGKS